MTMPMRIALTMFEGPFDLLLFLIRKNEVDIYDIPISELIDQYMEYLEVIKEINLDYAAEFIDMAATLMRIKSRLLLPFSVFNEEEGEQEEDPRAQLVQQLLSYRQFKEAGTDLRSSEEHQSMKKDRGYFAESEIIDRKNQNETEDYLESVTLFDLLIAFKKSLDTMPKVTTHVVDKYEITIEEQRRFIFSKLKKNKKLSFTELLKEVKEKIVAVVTFLAILEMTKAGELLLGQKNSFGELTVTARSGV